MKIVADQNIPLLPDFFSNLGDVVSLVGREISRNDLMDCDVLIIRSVTKVNETLLAGTPVKFVGTCTIGHDHIDVDYLKKQGIQWANAPGCNANAVVQYVFSSMAALKPDWREKSIGIIGCGNIGSRLLTRFKKLGVRVHCYDPFLSDKDQDSLVDFATVLNSDIISCHTPLTKCGPYPTYHLLDEAAFRKIPNGALIINSCRGGVVDEAALLKVLPDKQFKLAIDVWENEPSLNEEFLDKVHSATPHIAGYTLEGRENGTAMVYQALIDFLQIQGQLVEDVVTNNVVEFNTERLMDASLGENLNAILLSCYPIDKDDKRLREIKLQSNFGLYFDALRKNYPLRREYTHYNFPRWQEYAALKDSIDIIRNG